MERTHGPGVGGHVRLKSFRVGPPGGKGTRDPTGTVGVGVGVGGSETKHCEADRLSGRALVQECGFRDGGVLSCWRACMVSLLGNTTPKLLMMTAFYLEWHLSFVRFAWEGGGASSHDILHTTSLAALPIVEYTT